MEASNLIDRKKRLLLPVAVGLLFFLGFESGAFQLVLLRVAGEFNVGQSLMGFLVASQFIAIMLGPLLFGGLADRIGKKKIVMIFALVFIAGCFMASASANALLFIGGVFVLGIGYSVTECLVSAMLADNYPDNSDRYINISQTGFSLGAVIAPLLSGWLIDGVGLSWRWVFLIAGLGYILLYPLLCLSKSKLVLNPDGAKGLLPVKTVFKSKYFIIIFVAMLIYLGLENGVAYFADSTFTLEYSMPEVSVYAISLFWLTMAVSRFIFSRISARAERVLILCFAVSCALFLLLSSASGYVSALIIIGAAGFTFGPIWPMIIGLGARRFPRMTGTATSMLILACGLGGAVFPVFIGMMSDAAGMGAAFIMLAVFSALATLLMVRAKKEGNA